ncbi:MAG TPA: hypothetical protein PLF81_27125, partial [Candidatus Anammoximicrobium sp.]|nr:hypothetical protein [Candidatus Anammoximicrobium sp.]
MTFDHSLFHLGPLLTHPFFGWSALSTFDQSGLDLGSLPAGGIDKSHDVLARTCEVASPQIRFDIKLKISEKFHRDCRHCVSLQAPRPLSPREATNMAIPPRAPLTQALPVILCVHPRHDQYRRKSANRLRRKRIPKDAQIFELDLHRRTGVDLQADDPVAGRFAF